MMVAVGMMTITLAWSTPARAKNEAEVAEHLIELGEDRPRGGIGASRHH